MKFNSPDFKQKSGETGIKYEMRCRFAGKMSFKSDTALKRSWCVRAGTPTELFTIVMTHVEAP
jgi:hypothetical protein